MEFHRTVRYGDPEGGADGAFHEVDIATMGAEQLIWVCVDGEPTFDRADPGDRGIRTYTCGFSNLGDNRLDRHQAAIRGGLLRAAIGQRRLAEGYGALQRAHQLRRKALDPRIG